MLYERTFQAGNGRQCVRCGADIHPPDPPHICADLVERRAKQDAAISQIESILKDFRLDLVMPSHGGTATTRDLAEAIYRRMSGRDMP